MPADIRSFFGGGAKGSQSSSQKKEEVCLYTLSSEVVAIRANVFYVDRQSPTILRYDSDIILLIFHFALPKLCRHHAFTDQPQTLYSHQN